MKSQTFAPKTKTHYVLCPPNGSMMSSKIICSYVPMSPCSQGSLVVLHVLCPLGGGTEPKFSKLNRAQAFSYQARAELELFSDKAHESHPQ